MQHFLHPKITATIDTPWAKDADGKTIQTYYTIQGATLTQHIQHRVKGARYPVTGDPRVTTSWGITTIHFNRDETRDLAAGITGLIGSRSGNAATIFFSALGGGAVARWATSHGYCLAYRVVPYYMYSSSIWIERC